LVEQLQVAGVDAVFCVPGESYLPVLDGLYDVPDVIPVYSCRHDGGAAFMAEARGKLTGKPGVCFVTRGPGACNASIALHVARQDSTPMVLFVGQVSSRFLGCEAVQEIDYLQMFSSVAKNTFQATKADEVVTLATRALEIATSGRPGPVVVALPEDLLSAQTQAPVSELAAAPVRAPSGEQMKRLHEFLASAKRPIIIVGGSQWSDRSTEQLRAFAAEYHVPVCCSFRRHDIFDNTDPRYAGFLGLNADPALWKRVEQSDCVIAVGTRLDQSTTRGYRFYQPDGDKKKLIHISAEAQQLSKNLETALGIEADIPAFVDALSSLSGLPATRWKAWCQEAHADFLARSSPGENGTRLDLGRVMSQLNEVLSDDAVITVDAGNFTAWPQQFRRYRRPGRLLAPLNGAMGYGVPSAVSASLMTPQRQVVGFVGDGGMLMTGNELATAVQYNAKPIILVINNGMYGTIRLHQAKSFPGRSIATELDNPDFSAMARAFGAFGAAVESTEDFLPAFKAAVESDSAALLELRVDSDETIPGVRLSDLEAQA